MEEDPPHRSLESVRLFLSYFVAANDLEQLVYDAIATDADPRRIRLEQLLTGRVAKGEITDVEAGGIRLMHTYSAWAVQQTTTDTEAKVLPFEPPT